MPLKVDVRKAAPEEDLSLAPREPSLAISRDNQEKIEKLKSSIDFRDRGIAVTFGANLQGHISDFADSILREVRMKDSGYVGTLLGGLLAEVKTLDFDGLSPKRRLVDSLPVIGKFFNRLKRFVAGYDTVSRRIEGVVEQLHSARQNMLRDIVRLDALFEKNVDFLRELEIYIEAGEQMEKEAREQLLPELKRSAESPPDAVALQRYRDTEQLLHRFEKRVHDLKLTRTVALQTLPQIRLVQAGNQELAEKIQTSVLSTIPLWKNQIVLAISLLRQSSALELQRQVNETTNRLLIQNAALLRDGATGIATEAEKGIVEVETLKKVNAELIATVEDVMRIQTSGRERRLEAERELKSLEEELRERLTGPR